MCGSKPFISFDHQIPNPSIIMRRGKDAVEFRKASPQRLHTRYSYVRGTNTSVREVRINVSNEHEGVDNRGSEGGEEGLPRSGGDIKFWRPLGRNPDGYRPRAQPQP